MSDPPPGVLLTLDLAIQGEWADVERVRASVWNCSTSVLGRCSARDALAMVTAELLENAVKHGAHALASPRVRVRISADRGVVCVQNPVADDAAAERVLAILDWLRGFSSSAEAYRAKLLAAAAAAATQGSGLGLARVAYEGGCTLSARCEGRVLTITAEMPLDR